ncbi:hypothetical protein JRI60_00160 [Archangium violaceum]|uniref:hypothetical protein n=1 Tax=Archangium violaceum TaxID=83451 RepID=UPI00194EB62A|nr:hypothetical protein [Archangium violaceum]QRN97544.1 hypothetical protein JRI60_00160 [Archangium violaceum]
MRTPLPSSWWLLPLAALSLSACSRSSLAPGSRFVRCDNPTSDYSIAYPSAWIANSPGQVEPCRFFHPTAFTVQPGTEEPPLAVSVKRESLSLQDFIQGNTGPGYDVLQQERITLAGQPAVRLELRTTDESSFLPPGTREYLYAVSAGPNALVRVGTLDAPGLDYSLDKDVVDQMVRTLQLH